MYLSCFPEKKVNHSGKFFRGNFMYISQKCTTTCILTFYLIFTFGKIIIFFSEELQPATTGITSKNRFFENFACFYKIVLYHVFWRYMLYLLFSKMRNFFRGGYPGEFGTRLSSIRGGLFYCKITYLARSTQTRVTIVHRGFREVCCSLFIENFSRKY